MLIQPTLDTLNRLKLHGMALALSEQVTHNAAQGLAKSDWRSCSTAKSFTERTGA
jgi:hypothetical protein